MSLFNFTDDPDQASRLALAAGLLGGKGSFNSIVSNSLMGAQDAFSTAKQRQLSTQMTQTQLDEIKRKAEIQRKAQAAEDAFRASLVSPQMQVSQDALAGGGGPTAANAANLQAPDQSSEVMFRAMQAGLMSPLDYLKLQQKDESPLAVPEGTTFVNRKTMQPLFANKKADKGTSDMQEFAFAQGRGEVLPGVTFTDWMRANKKAGASNVSVNTGQKGYENESKLRNDFKSEPIYKDYQDMASAHKQIKAGIAANNPVGDLATATKIMKLLDPTSVVRESELGMAMAASGRMDRMKNFIELQVNGRKLTPTQLKEFGALSDELMKAAGQLYNQKRAEYAKMGKRYQLDESVLGAEYKAPGDGWSIKPK